MHVLVVHVGPVQEFIESARKCRDLWFGSWLLSELARSTARGIVAAEGRSEAEVLVFPGVSTSARDRAVANKIVARILRPAGDVAAEAERQMRATLALLRDAAFNRVGRGVANIEALFHRRVAEEQVDGAIEFLWAAAPEHDGRYKDALGEAERILAAVKNTKVWEQPSWAKEGVPKSSLDGVRESVLDEELFKPEHAPRRRAFGVHGSERLCGVGLLKRFGLREDDLDRARHGDVDPHRIFSTSHVASGPFRAGLKRLGAEAPWSRLCHELDMVDEGLLTRLDVVPSGRPDPVTGLVDGSVFYEGRLAESLEDLGFDPKRDRTLFERATQALRRFVRAVGPVGEPNPYYALILADGDRMGAVIDSLDSFEKHRRLSGDVEAFAASARGVVAEHGGALVYAGGDDVLALVPVHDALGCAGKLASEFRNRMASWVVGTDEPKAPTLSVGVAIVHQLMPLDEALDVVRGAQRAAKATEGKNALAVVVKKRGGEPVQVSGTWGECEQRLEALVALHRSGAISAKTQYELIDVDVRLGTSDELASVREVEARRILDRKRASGGLPLEEGPRHELERLGAFADPTRLGHELYVAQVIARARSQAEPSVVASMGRQDEVQS